MLCPSPAPHPTYVLRWDGSYEGGCAAVGITVHKCPPQLDFMVGDQAPELGVCLLSAAVPLTAGDATRTEALGPALAALLLSVIVSASEGYVCFIGDSQVVVGLL